ncbi:hypothetical protein KAR91_59585 [Candidatus Pacearchaeota archaeon]|nr:hypothetical protein [Candidatus Pacearchaeota archaeon]
MKRFVQTTEELYEAIIKQSEIAGCKIVIATGFTHTAILHRAKIINLLPHGTIAMKGINQLILRNGTRIYINSAGETSVMGLRPELIAIFECMHLNMVNTSSFIGNSLKAACDVIVNDNKPNGRVETLRIYGFEGL